MSEKNPHVLSEGFPGSVALGGHTLTPSIVFNRPADSEPIVTITHDGQIKLAHPEKMDEAARVFVDAVQTLLHREGPHVVRKKGVSEFMTICMGKVDWTQNDKFATQFARKADADEAAIGQNCEVVPAALALVF